LSLRILRLAKATAAISLASAPLVGLTVPISAAPALASVVRPTAPSYEWWLRTLQVTQAWRSGQGAGVTVAVLSDGVAPSERFLAGSVIGGPDYTRSGRSARSPYYGLLGTSLASLIAGHGESDYPNKPIRAVEGVAPAARVLSVRVTLSPGDPLWSDSRVTRRLPDAIAAGIRYAVSQGASVIDLPADPGIHDPAIASGSSAATGGSPAERSAVAYAVSRGVLLVAPAGDNGQAGDAANYPAAYPGVIAVGAFGRNFVKPGYSSRQPYVTLTAAGEGVAAASRNGFLAMNSTSAASAIAAGIAALIRSEFPNLTAAQVRDAMTHSTVYRGTSGLLDGSGYGTVNAERAITAAATMSPPNARPAMLGARPRSRPAGPMIQGTGSIIVHQLNGDAGFSALLLALLLIPITLYGLAMRKREQRETIAAAQRGYPELATSGHGSMLADPLLEFFGPQHASRPADRPAAVRQPPTPRFAPRPGLTGRSTMSAPLAARPSAPLGAAPGLGPARPVTGPARAAAAAGSLAPGGSGTPGPPPVPGGRQAAPIGIETSPIVRQAEVTGSPPWAPAERPTSDLPWAVIPPPQVAPRPAGPDIATIPPPPPDSVWDSAPAARSAVSPRRPLAPETSAPSSLFDPGPGRSPSGSHRAPFPPAPVPPGAQGSPAASAPAAAPVPGDSGASQQPSTWKDLPRRSPDRSAGRQRRGASGQQDSERGPIFVWTPMSSSDRDK
jgi:hypothetical protein